MGFLQGLLAKIVGVLAPMLFEKTVGLLTRLGIWLKHRITIKRNRAQDETNAQNYETTLQDGTNEQTQVDATLDVLNRRKPK